MTNGKDGGSGDDVLDGLEDWDDLFDALHEPDEVDADAELEAARAREAAQTRSGERVLDPTQYVFESDTSALGPPDPERSGAEQLSGREPTPIPAGDPVLADEPSSFAESPPTQTGVGSDDSALEAAPAAQPEPGSPFEPSGDELEDFLDFDSQAEALGDLLGAPPPLPPADESKVQAMPAPPASPPRPPSPPPTPPAAAPSVSATETPSLAPAPTDDELFGDLPEALPEEVAPMKSSPMAEATRVVDAAALDDLARAAGGEDHTESTRIAELSAIDGLVAETAKPEDASAPAPRRSSPAIVRRDELERKRRAEEAGDSDFANDFAGGESTRIADLASLDAMAQSEAEAAAAAKAAAAEFFADEPESLELELDEDFYDDIEIGASTDTEVDEPAPVPPPVAPTRRTASRRTTAHIVRRSKTEPPVDAPVEGPVVVMEADFEDEVHDAGPMTSGSIDLDELSDSGDDMYSSAPPIADLSPEPPPPQPTFADDSADDGNTSTHWPVATLTPAASPFDEVAADDDDLDVSSPPPPAAEAPAAVDPEDDPARAKTVLDLQLDPAQVPALAKTVLDLELEPDALARAAAAQEVLEEVDVAPELPPGVFSRELPGLDPAAITLPEKVDPVIEDRTEEWAGQLLVYERELESLDEPGALARLRVEAGRLSERLGDADRARTHYEAALVADNRACAAMRGLRRVERAMSRWTEAVAAIDAQLPFASKMERRALAAHRADMLMAAGEQDLARVAVGELLDEAPHDVRALLAQLELAFVDGRDEELAPCLEALTAHLEDERLVAVLGGVGTRLSGEHRSVAALEGDEDPQLAAAWAWRRASTALRDDRIDDARAALANASSAAVSDPLVAELRARVLGAAGDPLAAAAWRTVAEGSPDVTVRAHAWRQLAAGMAGADPAGAAAALGEAIALDPGDAASATTLEAALERAGDHESLIEILGRAVEADLTDDLARVRLALRLVALGRLDEAAERVRAGIEAARDAGRELSAPLFETLAQIHAAQGDLRARAGLLARVADGRRDNLAAWYRAARAGEAVALTRLAEHQAGGGDAEESAAVVRDLTGALELWRQVLDLSPESRAGHAAACRLAEATGDGDILENALLVAQAAERYPAGVVSIALRRVALLLGRADPDVSGAEDVLREAGALAPGDVRATLPQVILAAGADRWAEAAQVIEERATQLGERRESMALRYRAAAILLDRGDDPARAAELLAPVVDGVAGFEAAADLTASAHRRLGDASALAADLDRASAASAGLGAGVEGARGDAFSLLVREAELYEHKVGDPAKAVDIYAKALELRPGDPLARGGFARAAAAAGEAAPIAELALADLKHAEEIGDNAAKADAYQELARIDAELRGDHESALLSWEAAVDADPTRLTALRVLERTYLAEKRTDDLRGLYDKQLAALGESSDALGVILARLRLTAAEGRPASEVLADCRRAIAVDPRCRVALFRLETAARTGAPDEELANLELAIADYYADDPIARATFTTRAGETLLGLRKIDAAIAHFKAAADMVEGGHGPALSGWRRAAMAGELWLDLADAAQREAETAVTDRDRAALYHLAGVALMDKALAGEQAVGVLRKVLAVDPAHRDAFVRLRILFDEQGQHEDLAQLLTDRLACETDRSNRVEILATLAELARNFLDDREAARAHLSAILEIDPDNRAAVASLSDIAWEKGEWPVAAETLIRRARLETDPAVLKQIFYRLGTIYTDRLPDHRFAIRSFQKVLGYDPTDRGALDKLSELAVQTGDWKNALAACERLIKSAADPTETVSYWHRVARIYTEGFANRPRAEQALRRALDADPTSAAALDALVGFYQQAGDTRSMKIHLDQVAAGMRTRIGQRGLDPQPFRVLARALEAREQAGAAGSLATARCAAELARLLGGAEEREERLAAHAAQVKPPVARLGKREDDDYLFPASVSSALRQIATTLGERMAKHVGTDLRRYGVGRGDLQKNTAEANLVAEIASEMGADGADLYVSSRNPRLLVAEPTQPVSIIVGSEILAVADASALRFAAGRSLKLSLSALAVFARMELDDFGVILAALVRQFVETYRLPGVSEDAVATEQQRMRRLIPSSMADELKLFVLNVASSKSDHRQVWQGIRAGGNRAGLLAGGSVAAAIRMLSQEAGYADLASAARDPMIGDLIRFSVSEEHAVLRGKLGG